MSEDPHNFLTHRQKRLGHTINNKEQFPFFYAFCSLLYKRENLVLHNFNFLSKVSQLKANPYGQCNQKRKKKTLLFSFS